MDLAVRPTVSVLIGQVALLRLVNGDTLSLHVEIPTSLTFSFELKLVYTKTHVILTCPAQNIPLQCFVLWSSHWNIFYAFMPIKELTSHDSDFLLASILLLLDFIQQACASKKNLSACFDRVFISWPWMKSEAIYQTVIWLHNMHGTIAVSKRKNLLAVRTLAQALECFEGH